MSQSIGPQLRHYWQKCSGLPFGKTLFSKLLGFMVPYTGTIGARVEHLEPGHGKVSLRMRRKVSNHLRSVHAIALINMAEMSTGLSLLNSLPDNTRGILTGIQMQYFKKARGLLMAECYCDIPTTNQEQEMNISADIKDEAGEVVATGKATWLIGPEK